VGPAKGSRDNHKSFVIISIFSGHFFAFICGSVRFCSVRILDFALRLHFSNNFASNETFNGFQKKNLFWQWQWIFSAFRLSYTFHFIYSSSGSILVALFYFIFFGIFSIFFIAVPKVFNERALKFYLRAQPSALFLFPLFQHPPARSLVSVWIRFGFVLPLSLWSKNSGHVYFIKCA